MLFTFLFVYVQAYDQKLFAIGDIHGDYDQLLTALQLAKITDLHDNWVAKNSTLVQLGDIVDRGHQSLESILLLEKYKIESQENGGNVFTLLGNHELMNLMGDYRYISKQELSALPNSYYKGDCSAEVQLYTKSKPVLSFDEQQGLNVWRRLLQLNCWFGEALRNRLAATIQGNGICRSLFVHAGIKYSHLQSINREKGLTSGEEFIDILNSGIKNNLSFCRENGCISSPRWFSQMMGESGPFWMRDFVRLKDTQLCNDVEKVVLTLGVERIIVGHNITEKGKIETKCNGLIHFIDVGMSKSYYGNLAVWTCDQHNGPQAMYGNGKTVKLQNYQKQEL